MHSDDQKHADNFSGDDPIHKGIHKGTLAGGLGYTMSEPGDPVQWSNALGLQYVGTAALTSIWFKFQPLEYVVIEAYGLQYRGRVCLCLWNGFLKTYDVEYAADGKIDTRTFLEDELAPDHGYKVRT